jgi:uncharacterized protein YkwD
MSVAKDRIILLCIGLYLVFAYFASSSISYQVLHTNGPGQVLGTSRVGKPTITMPENSGLPNLNAIFGLNNATRSNNGLDRLQLDNTLTKLAQSRADDMAQRGYFGHRSPEGLYYYDQLQQTPFENTYSCENLALSSSLEPQTYLGQWLASTTGHKECLLDTPATRVGYGVAKLAFDHTKGFDSESYIVVAIQAR